MEISICNRERRPCLDLIWELKQSLQTVLISFNLSPLEQITLKDFLSYFSLSYWVSIAKNPISLDC